MGPQGTKVGSAYIDITANTDKFRRGMADMDVQARRAGASMQGAFNKADVSAKALNASMGGMLKTGAALALLMGAGGGFAQGAKILADFSQVMSTVKAVTQATAEEMAMLTAEAQRLGGTTRFSATEAGEAMKLLAQAGMSVSEVMASVGGALTLAQAGGVELGAAAEITGTTLAGFGLKAAEAGRVVDVLAEAANASNSGILDLGEALKFAAPTASALGLKLEETVAIIGKLSDGGLKGGLAGRGFQSLTTQLVNNKEKIEAIIGPFNVATDGLASVLRKLREANITTAQVLDIFSGENLDVFQVLSSSAIDAERGIENLNARLLNAKGVAAEVSAVMDDNLNGALLNASSAFEALVLAIGKAGGTAALVATFEGLTTVLLGLADALTALTTGPVQRMEKQTASLAAAIKDTDDQIAKGGLKDLGDDATSALQPLTEVEKKIAEINKRLEETGERSRINAISRIEGGMIMQLAEIGRLEDELNRMQAPQVGRGGDAGFTVGSRSAITATQKALDDARREYGNALIRLDDLKKAPIRPPNGAASGGGLPADGASAREAADKQYRGYYTALEVYERNLADIRAETAKGATDGNRLVVQSMIDYLEAGGNLRRVLTDVQALSGSLLDPKSVEIINQFMAAMQTAETITVADALETELTDFTQTDGGPWIYFEQRIADATKAGLMNAIETGDWGEAFGQALTDITREALSNAIDVLWKALEQIDWGGQGTGWAGFFNSIGGSFTSKAGGGYVSAGQLTRVGELGSEWFMPKTDGYIIPNGGMGKSLGAPMQISVGGAQVVIQGDASERTAAMIAESLSAYTRALPGMIDNRVRDRQMRGAY